MVYLIQLLIYDFRVLIDLIYNYYYPPGQFYLDGFKEKEVSYPIWCSSICSKVNDRNAAYYEFIILFFLHLSVVLCLFIFYVSVLKYKYIPE